VPFMKAYIKTLLRILLTYWKMNNSYLNSKLSWKYLKLFVIIYKHFLKIRVLCQIVKIYNNFNIYILFNKLELDYWYCFRRFELFCYIPNCLIFILILK
jgi:hypothetical protein